jgi:hypothetical protein
MTDDELIQQGIRDCNSTVAGRELLFYILDNCAIYAPTMPDQMLEFNVGRKSIGIDLVELMNSVDPKIYPELLLERAKNERRDNE